MTVKKYVKNKYVVACSGGKDSVATILISLEKKEPLDEVVWVEVMFDKETSGEVPEHRAFVYDSLKPFCEENGIQFTVLHSSKTYDDVFHQTFKRGKNNGKKYGFARGRGCFVNRECKLKAFKEYKRQQESNIVFYVGIAADEPKRLERLNNKTEISLLAKYGISEKDALKLCKKYNLLSPVYEISRRNGCWFCPYTKNKELLHFLKNNVDKFDRLIEWEKEENLSCYNMNFTEKPSEIKARLLSSKQLDKN